MPSLIRSGGPQLSCCSCRPDPVSLACSCQCSERLRDKFALRRDSYAQPGAQRYQVNAVPKPAGSARFPQTVQVMLLADRPSLAGNLCRLSQVIFPIHDRRLAMPAIKPRFFSDRLKLPQEMPLGFVILV
jgi:hypothetical protein